MTRPGPLMRLVRETQDREQFEHCPHGTTERKVGSLEAWFHQPQPDNHIEYWLHVCNVANPELAMRIYKRTLLHAFPPEPAAEEATLREILRDYLRRFALDEASIDEITARARPPMEVPRYRRWQRLAWRTSRWALDLEESLGPVHCVPLICEIVARESAYTDSKRNLFQVSRDLWEWWKTLTTPKEWAGGHF